jgi:hypothetical protein
MVNKLDKRRCAYCFHFCDNISIWSKWNYLPLHGIFLLIRGLLYNCTKVFKFTSQTGIYCVHTWRNKETNSKSSLLDYYRNPLGNRARICRPFKEPKNRFQALRAVRQPYLSYRPDRLHRLAKSIPQNRFLDSINVYKYGLRVGAGVSKVQQPPRPPPPTTYTVTKLNKDDFALVSQFLHGYIQT